MVTVQESSSSPIDWRTIGALNLVSTLAQVGQFGIAFVVLPVWLSAQGLDATQLGMFASSLWLGQLPGLALAPWLCQRIGARWVIVAGLLCTVGALGAMALSTVNPLLTLIPLIDPGPGGDSDCRQLIHEARALPHSGHKNSGSKN